jgi:hypothetical protein
MRARFALLVAGLGLSVALAGPTDKAKTKPTPPSKSEPKLSLPKGEPKLPPLGLKPEPKRPGPPNLEPRLPSLPAKIDPKPLPKPSLPKPGAGSVIKPDLKPTLPPVVKPEPKLTLPPVVKPDVKPGLPPEVKQPGKLGPRPILIHEKPKSGKPTELPKGPGLKLPGGTKIDPTELSKIKPPVDLTKVKPETVLASKPPSDFKVKPIKLDQIHVPGDAPVIEKLNVKNVQVNQKFVVNKNFYAGGDYHTKFGVKTVGGFYCYPGIHHSHWHHCVWDPSFGCHYYFCPSASCYYYWCATAHCYYPCHWFVDYGSCYYPWWICGGIGGYGYVATPHISIFIGW